MNDLQIFNNEEFGEVRTAVINDEPMFCLADICRVLEIKNVSDCKSRLRQKGIVTTDTLTNGGKQKMIFIDESNLYKTIFQSRKESGAVNIEAVYQERQTVETESVICHGLEFRVISHEKLR